MSPIVSQRALLAPALRFDYSPLVTTHRSGEPDSAARPAWGRMLINVLFASVGYVAIRIIIAPVRIKLLTSLLSKEDYALLTLTGHRGQVA